MAVKHRQSEKKTLKQTINAVKEQLANLPEVAGLCEEILTAGQSINSPLKKRKPSRVLDFDDTLRETVRLVRCIAKRR